MPVIYRSNPLSRDIKPQLEATKKGIISVDAKSWSPHLVAQKPQEKVIRDFKLRRKIESEEAKRKHLIPRKSRKEYVDQITRMLEEGMTYRAIAAELGLTASQVSGMIYRMRGKK